MAEVPRRNFVAHVGRGTNLQAIVQHRAIDEKSEVKLFSLLYALGVIVFLGATWCGDPSNSLKPPVYVDLGGVLCEHTVSPSEFALGGQKQL